MGLAALVAALVWRGRSVLRDPPRPVVEQLIHRLGAVRAARFAPDGRVIFTASFEGKPEEVFGKTSASVEPQSLGLTDALLLGVSSSGDLALLLEPRFTRAWSMHGTLARVGGVGGTPRELVEQVEFADWSPSGELAVVRDLGTKGTVEFPVGKVLFQTTGWISNPRFSRTGDRIAFLHHPVRNDDMGEPMVVDLHGQSKVLGPRWPRVLGLAWSPDGTEVLFTAGQDARNVVVAVSEEGRTRELYTSPADLRIEDVAPDGAVLATGELERSEIGLSGAGQGDSIFTWGYWATSVARVSDQGSVLFSESAPVAAEKGQMPTQPTWALFRRFDRNAVQILGVGLSLDLSPDGRSALVMSPDRRTLTALPIGPGQSQPVQTHGMEVKEARWFRDGKRLLATCRNASETDYHLIVLPQDGSSATRLSDTPVLGLGRRALHLSPDDRWAATLDKNETLVLFSTKDGGVSRLPEAGPDAVPRGWSAEGHLWVTQGGDRTPVRARLLRFDVEARRLLEERKVGPSETSGTIFLREVAISPDGRSVAFIYGRNLGYLYVLRGLLRQK
jgi:hypothetical protein